MTDPERKSMISEASDVRPVLLAPDNFTPRTRTPWAGREIHTRFKAAFSQEMHIGESWEVSCDPAFPSMVLGAAGTKSTMTLQALIDQHPEAMISPQLAGAATGQGTSELLVKLVNAASPLSLQVHPDDDDPALTVGECGKPESWLVLHAEPGTGIYLGFKREWKPDALRAALQSGQFSADDLFFVPVQENDYFEIGPGIVHAIGAGVTLLEPQRIRRGKGGKTYRLWDWNRRYDAKGIEDPVGGMPRELHVDQALRCFDPSRQHGPEFAGSVMRKATRQHPVSGVDVAIWPANPNYQVRRIRMMPGVKCQIITLHGQGFGSLTVFSGSLDCNGVRIAAGTSAFVPWRSLPAALETALGADFALITHAAMSIDISPVA